MKPRTLHGNTAMFLESTPLTCSLHWLSYIDCVWQTETLVWLFFSSLSPLKNTLLFWQHGLNSFSWSVSFTLACQVTIHINTDFHPGAMLESHFLTSATSKNRGAEKSVSRTLALVTFSLYICLDIRELFCFFLSLRLCCLMWNVMKAIISWMYFADIADFCLI